MTQAKIMIETHSKPISTNKHPQRSLLHPNKTIWRLYSICTTKVENKYPLWFPEVKATPHSLPYPE